ncbi:recombinase family protein [Photobacterium japonica]|uniref:recombinase family protein n=1 Tax=Photobacterium japonica TaxID=2910235 RepID=UPI003D0C01BB
MEFAYTRVSTQTQTDNSQEVDILKQFPSIEIYRDICSGTIPANERPQLSRLLDKLRKGDTLVVWWIDRLGRDYHNSETVIRELLNAGVTIKTINQNLTFEYTGEDMTDMITNIQITMITAMAAAERKNRLASAEAGRQAIKQNPELWAEKFQGRQRDQEKTAKIIELLESGMSIRKVAAELECNPSTVQRAKKLISVDNVANDNS